MAIFLLRLCKRSLVPALRRAQSPRFWAINIRPNFVSREARYGLESQHMLGGNSRPLHHRLAAHPKTFSHSRLRAELFNGHLDSQPSCVLAHGWILP